MDKNSYYLECWFSGRVQGVGFRYRTYRIAKQFPKITGRVRNLRDGRVYLQAEGPEGKLTAFQKSIEEKMEGFIDPQKTVSKITQRPPVFKNFKILRWQH